MLSILVPIARYPFFVHAVLGNVAETCGLPLDQIDFVFLTACNPPPYLTEAFKVAHKEHKFRVVQAPFEAPNNHLPLLDWAMHHADLQDWVLLQHCDLFWTKNTSWLPRILANLDDKHVAFNPPHSQPVFTYKDRGLVRMQDYLGVYNRKFFCEQDFSYQWGTLGGDLKLSEFVMQAVDSGDLKWKGVRPRKVFPSNRDMIRKVDWMDGSVGIGLELGVRFPERIKQFRYEQHLHLWQLFKWGNRINRRGRTLRIKKDKSNKEYTLTYYSYLSSKYFDLAENHPVLPWKVYNEMFPGEIDDRVKRAMPFLDSLQRFCKSSNVCGLDNDLDIIKVEFLNDKVGLDISIL